MEGTGSRR
uniref:Uncharacterized protein n=1 Tax=Anguilla anguilla TaxID=7936 RepID=A0A0E9SG37_ANGAN